MLNWQARSSPKEAVKGENILLKNTTEYLASTWNPATCDLRGVKHHYFIYLSVAGAWQLVSFFSFPGGWLGKSTLKEFYTQSNTVTDKLDEKETNKAADYLLSVETQMEGKKESHQEFQDHRYFNSNKKYYVFQVVFLPLNNCFPRQTLYFALLPLCTI